MIAEDRIDQINRLLPVLQSSAWAQLLQERIADHTNRLIGENNEQTRGAIKELRILTELPGHLQSELAWIRMGRCWVLACGGWQVCLGASE